MMLLKRHVKKSCASRLTCTFDVILMYSRLSESIFVINYRDGSNYLTCSRKRKATI